MIKAIAHLQSTSPYSQSAHYCEPMLDKENKDAYERRTWRMRMHRDEEGWVVIPGIQFQHALQNAAKRLQLQIPGKGKTQYTKYFDAGILVEKNLRLPIKVDQVQGVERFVPSDGVSGSGKRVMKVFGEIPSWAGDVEYVIVDHTITADVFKKVLDSCGLSVGVGRWRPENKGHYGRFIVTTIKWDAP